MLIAVLNIPFEDTFCDTQEFMQRVDAEVASREFDILVLPSQPYRRVPIMSETRTQMERSTRALIDWLSGLSARKHALIVCGTTERARNHGIYRTALAAFDGRLIARHVKFPERFTPHQRTPVNQYITVIDSPHFAQEVSIALDEDLWCPLPLMAVSRSCMSLVSCLSLSTRLMDRARSVAIRFGVFVALSTYGSVEHSEFGRCHSTVLTPVGNEICEGTGAPSLLVAEVPDIPAWTETWSRLAHRREVQAQNLPDHWRFIGSDPLNEMSGFYVP